MGLHSTIRAAAATPPPILRVLNDIEDDLVTDVYEDEEGGECPECGTYSWQNTFYGSYKQTKWYDFGRNNGLESGEIEGGDVEDEEGWECDNGHTATSYIREMLENQ